MHAKSAMPMPFLCVCGHAPKETVVALSGMRLRSTSSAGRSGESSSDTCGKICLMRMVNPPTLIIDLEHLEAFTYMPCMSRVHGRGHHCSLLDACWQMHLHAAFLHLKTQRSCSQCRGIRQPGCAAPGSGGYSHRIRRRPGRHSECPGLGNLQVLLPKLKHEACC